MWEYFKLLKRTFLVLYQCPELSEGCLLIWHIALYELLWIYKKFAHNLREWVLHGEEPFEITILQDGHRRLKNWKARWTPSLIILFPSLLLRVLIQYVH